jgi:hypothetical protein
MSDFSRVNKEFYWALSHMDDLVQDIRVKISDYNRTIKYSRYLDLLIRNWRYYHNIYYPDNVDYLNTAIKFFGEQGELAGISSNHIRNLVQHLLTLTTSQRPSWQARAINSDNKSLQQARLGTNVLEYYMREKQLDRLFKLAVEHSLIWAQGFIKCTWDPGLGEPMGLDEGGNLFFEGDICVEVPTVFDVMYDTRCRSWEALDWVCVRSKRNRWDLAKRFPEYEEEIIGLNEQEEFRPFEIGYPGSMTEESDYISVWEFFHKKTESIPEGRYVAFVGEYPLFDFPLPYDDLPVHRVTPGEMMGLPFGYTPVYDLTGLQEAYNHQLSAILSNHKSFAVQNVWVKLGTNLTAKQCEGGLNLIESSEAPQALNLTSTPQEVFTFADLLKRDMEILSGVSSVTRGELEGKLSGTAMALLDSKSVQQASHLIHSYTSMLESVGTSILRMLKTFAKSERFISIIGKHERIHRQQFTADDLQGVDRVVVDTANAMTHTAAGRQDLADKMLSSGLIRTPEEYLNVVNTGQIDTLMEADNAQLSLVRDENESLMDGGPAFVLPIDNHQLHIREHATVISNVESRSQSNNPIVAGVLAHIGQHIQAMEDPMWTPVITVLGYSALPPPPPPMGPDGMPQGGLPPGMAGGASAIQGPVKPNAQPPNAALTEGPKTRPAKLPKVPQPVNTGAPVPA